MCQWRNKCTQCIIGIAPQFKTVCMQKLPFHSCSRSAYLSRERIGRISNNSIPQRSQVSTYLMSAASYWPRLHKNKLTLNRQCFYKSLSCLTIRSYNTTPAIIGVALQRTIQHKFVFSIKHNISQRVKLVCTNYIFSFQDQERRARSCPIRCSFLHNSQVPLNDTMVTKLANQVTSRVFCTRQRHNPRRI